MHAVTYERNFNSGNNPLAKKADGKGGNFGEQGVYLSLNPQAKTALQYLVVTQ